MATKRYKHPDTEHIEEYGLAWLWTLLFGCIYFAVKGIWTHAVVGLILAFITFGISWLIYPFFADKILDNHLRKQGYKPLPTES